jgi:hypothetical protein
MQTQHGISGRETTTAAFYRIGEPRANRSLNELPNVNGPAARGVCNPDHAVGVAFEQRQLLATGGVPEPDGVSIVSWPVILHPTSIRWARQPERHYGQAKQCQKDGAKREEDSLFTSHGEEKKSETGASDNAAGDEHKRLC